MSRTIMREQNPAERIGNFNEVALGYSEEEALREAERCLQCRNSPCTEGCPAQVPIKDFISLLKKKYYEGAYFKIKEKNNLPAVCGRVCPQEAQCEKSCVLAKKGEPVAIGRLERFVADWGISRKLDYGREKKSLNGKRAAVVGSGPAGITCAADLAAKGYKVTVFEALHKPGGVMIYGIPEFRLPKSIVEYEIEAVLDLGVELKLNYLYGKNIDIKSIKKEFDILFIGSGAGLPKYMNIPGEELNSCYSANEFLTRINLMKAWNFPKSKTPVFLSKRCIVTGGGNVAMDAARCAKRLGADVTVVYRRTRNEMPARNEEIEHAIEEGVKFNFLSSPVRYEGNDKGFVTSAVIEKMVLGEPDASGRRRPVSSGEFTTMPAESVIVAIGNVPNPLVGMMTEGLETTDRGTVKVDENMMTSIPGVFAGGDITTGAATVIEAIGAGKKAAEAVDRYIRNIYRRIM